MKKVFFSILIGLSLLLSGCGDSASTSVKVEAKKAGAYIVFDKEHNNIPYPNNILFAGSVDGTLNIPYEKDASDANVKAALDALDGFSTTSPITVGFNGEINATTLINGLKVYEIATDANASTGGVPIIQGITRKLNYQTEYVPVISGNKIVILPTKPLDGNQSYMVVLTTDITDNAGAPIAPDLVSELFLREKPLVDAQGNHTTLPIDLATQLEGIRQATDAMIQYTVGYTAAIQQPIPRENIVAVWSFKTQTIGAVAKAFVDANASANLTVASMDINTSLTRGSGHADIWKGTLKDLPYYLGIPSQTNPIAPLTTHFVGADGNDTFIGTPKLTAKVTIPVLMTKPNADSQAVKAGATAPWPIVIFQHGITENRTNVLAIADALADAGYAAIAIDLPLHGITDTNSLFYDAGHERTFDLDLMNNDTKEVGKPDKKIDDSGTYYINLKHLLTSRDNVRQTTSDLVALKNALSGLSDIDASRVAFVGHSLGTIAPFGFLAHTNLESVTLAMPGGGIAQLLNNSVRFGPIIAAGLAKEGVMKGTSDYDAFMLAVQTVVDDGDPINYAMQIKQKIFAIEVVGDSQTGHLPDQVIPNNVPTAPLAGTDPLVNYLQAVTLSGNTGDSVAPNKTARYIVGNHSSILDPSESPEATVSMQRQVAAFVGSQDHNITIIDDTLLNTGYTTIHK